MNRPPLGATYFLTGFLVAVGLLMGPSTLAADQAGEPGAAASEPVVATASASPGPTVSGSPAPASPDGPDERPGAGRDTDPGAGQPSDASAPPDLPGHALPPLDPGEPGRGTGTLEPVGAGGTADAPPGRGARRAEGGARASFIVTLAVADSSAALDPGRAGQRARAVQRARRSEQATDALERRYEFKATDRYRWALAGFAADLTPGQARQLARDPDVAGIRAARTIELAAQSVPVGVRRVRAQPSGGPAPDVDVDVAVIDTGIGPVGGNELNVAGGVNCSGDGLADERWEDRYPSGHGTHVAGIVGARDNGIGVVGVAPGARLWSLRVFTSTGYGDEATVMCALDWAVATHSPAPPAGSQPIEVINMSLVGPRPVGGPEACGVASDPDPEHVAICSAVAAGMTVVVAAGNAARSARDYSPAGYDQVVTVGAISDFDGLPGGSSEPTCASTSFGTERDDAYARYSNFGTDVDLVAPGSCVVSTAPSSDGEATRRLTGTSMATPHVAGAAARLMARDPGASPDAVRAALRVSGTLDWDAASDPDWGGPGSSRGPDRLLDVGALLAPQPDVGVWILPGRLAPRVDETRASSRVEVQRIGGLSEPVTLDVTGLPLAVGSWSFSAGPVVSGSDTGRRLIIDLRDDAPDGQVVLDVTASGSGGSPSDSDDLKLLVDRTGPAISGPELRIRIGHAIDGRRRAMVRASWLASDELGAVARTSFQRGTAAGGWQTLATAGPTGTDDSRFPLERALRLRVRATDVAGNRTTRLVRRTLDALDPAGRSTIRSGRWRDRSTSGAMGGDLLASSQVGATLTTSFTGRGAAIVAPVGPDRGAFRVRVDDGPWTSVELTETRDLGRWVVFSRSLANGPHTMSIEVLEAPVAVDAVIVVR